MLSCAFTWKIGCAVSTLRDSFGIFSRPLAFLATLVSGFSNLLSSLFKWTPLHLKHCWYRCFPYLKKFPQYMCRISLWDLELFVNLDVVDLIRGVFSHSYKAWSISRRTLGLWYLHNVEPTCEGSSFLRTRRPPSPVPQAFISWCIWVVAGIVSLSGKGEALAGTGAHSISSMDSRHKIQATHCLCPCNRRQCVQCYHMGRSCGSVISRVGFGKGADGATHGSFGENGNQQHCFVCGAKRGGFLSTARVYIWSWCNSSDGIFQEEIAQP